MRTSVKIDGCKINLGRRSVFKWISSYAKKLIGILRNLIRCDLIKSLFTQVKITEDMNEHCGRSNDFPWIIKFTVSCINPHRRITEEKKRIIHMMNEPQAKKIFEIWYRRENCYAVQNVNFNLGSVIPEIIHIKAHGKASKPYQSASKVRTLLQIFNRHFRPKTKNICTLFYGVFLDIRSSAVCLVGKQISDVRAPDGTRSFLFRPCAHYGESTTFCVKCVRNVGVENKRCVMEIWTRRNFKRPYRFVISFVHTLQPTELVC